MKLVKWLFCGVILALAPLLSDYFIMSNHIPAGANADWREVIAKGELLLVSAAIAGASLAELFGSGKRWLALKIAAGVGCVLILTVASQLYTSTASDIRIHAAYNVDNLVSSSRLLFFCALGAGAGCALLGD